MRVGEGTGSVSWPEGGSPNAWFDIEPLKTDVKNLQDFLAYIQGKAAKKEPLSEEDIRRLDYLVAILYRDGLDVRQESVISPEAMTKIENAFNKMKMIWHEYYEHKFDTEGCYLRLASALNELIS